MKGRHILPAVIAILSVAAYAAGIHIRNGGDGIIGHLLYQFCHVNVWHLLANLAALYSIASSQFRMTALTWVSAYVISSLWPCSSPTEGMSGLLYAMMGIISWQAADKRKFHLWCGAFIGICFLMPQAVNGWLHVWCYIIGCVVSLVVALATQHTGH